MDDLGPLHPSHEEQHPAVVVPHQEDEGVVHLEVVLPQAGVGALDSRGGGGGAARALLADLKDGPGKGCHVISLSAQVDLHMIRKTQFWLFHRAGNYLHQTTC